jgi:two-component system OmpR family response regulator
VSASTLAQATGDRPIFLSTNACIRDYPSLMAPAGTTSRILVVDDDRRLCGFLAKFLTNEGYAIAAAHDGQKMRRALADDAYDLVILDLSFPQGDDGMTLARGLRAQYEMPLIMLSGKNTTIDKVVCLEIGADDYITKPFEPRELLARIRTVLRRAAHRVDVPGTPPQGASTISFCGWRLDLARHELFSARGEAVKLTTQEFQILAALARRPGRVLSRDQILDIVANRHWTPYDRSIDVLIGKIRRKMQDDAAQNRFIKTVRGIGYMFVPPLAEL